MNCSVFLPTITQLLLVNIRGFWKQISTKKYSVNCQSTSNVFLIYGREIWTALYFYETLIKFSINILELKKKTTENFGVLCTSTHNLSFNSHETKDKPQRDKQTSYIFKKPTAVKGKHDLLYWEEWDGKQNQIISKRHLKMRLPYKESPSLQIWLTYPSCNLLWVCFVSAIYLVFFN